MRPPVLLALVVLLSPGALRADPPTPTNILDRPTRPPAKPPAAAVGPVREPVASRPRTGGDTIANAVPILALPYHDSGNTCTFVNDYDEVCPYVGSTSPDVVYRFDPPMDEVVRIDLCASLYDTKVYVYENWVGNLIDCNDDAGCGITGWQSLIETVTMDAGNTYYIVVDGYGGECGEYSIDLGAGPCYAPCPIGGMAEGEPECHDDYVDQTNGGCNSDPPVFLDAPCSADGSAVAVCGTYGGFDLGGQYARDTDWYRVDAAGNVDGLTWCLGDVYVPTLMGYIAVQPCEEIPDFDDWLWLDLCHDGCLEIPPGDWWLWVGTSVFGAGVGCGHTYVWTLEGYACPPVAVESVGWGAIKARYRAEGDGGSRR